MSAAASEAASAAAGTGLRRRKQTPFYKPGNNTMETPESVALPGYLDATKYMPENSIPAYLFEKKIKDFTPEESTLVREAGTRRTAAMKAKNAAKFMTVSPYKLLSQAFQKDFSYSIEELSQPLVTFDAGPIEGASRQIKTAFTGNVLPRGQDLSESVTLADVTPTVHPIILEEIRAAGDDESKLPFYVVLTTNRPTHASFLVITREQEKPIAFSLGLGFVAAASAGKSTAAAIGAAKVAPGTVLSSSGAAGVLGAGAAIVSGAGTLGKITVASAAAGAGGMGASHGVNGEAAYGAATEWYSQAGLYSPDFLIDPANLTSKGSLKDYKIVDIGFFGNNQVSRLTDFLREENKDVKLTVEISPEDSTFTNTGKVQRLYWHLNQMYAKLALQSFIQKTNVNCAKFISIIFSDRVSCGKLIETPWTCQSLVEGINDDFMRRVLRTFFTTGEIAPADIELMKTPTPKPRASICSKEGCSIMGGSRRARKSKSKRKYAKRRQTMRRK